MTAADLRLSSVQESALREAEEFGEWFPESVTDWRVAESLARCGLFRRAMYKPFQLFAEYRITAAGRDWLATHPTEVVR